MTVLVLALLFCCAIGAAVVGYVAVEAHRDGRDVLTPQGEQLLADVRRRGDHLRKKTPETAARD